MMKSAAVCAAIVIALAIAWVTPARGQQGKFDLIIRAGHVIDPRNGINALMDVAIAAGKIAEVAARIDPALSDRNRVQPADCCG